jgi:hypothetical protein
MAFMLTVVVAAAIAAATWYFGLYAGSAAGQVALGESYEGDPLPAAHPLRVSLASSRQGPASAAPGLASSPAPLTLRRGCAWGRPGGNPYRGTVEQALVSAALPAEVVQAIAAQVYAGTAVDQLEITNQAIRAQGSGRVFSTHNIAMTYGMTLCVGTRVNFKPGHLERAALYEASDKAGRMYAVMVPAVCGNVSVLGEQASAQKRMAAAGGATAQDLTIRWMPAVLDPPERAQASSAGRSGFQSVPEPGTLGCVLAGLALMGWFWRRR